MFVPGRHATPAVLVVALSALDYVSVFHELSVLGFELLNIPGITVRTLSDLGLAAYVTVFAFSLVFIFYCLLFQPLEFLNYFVLLFGKQVLHLRF